MPFFTSGELSKLEKACRGNTFAQRRDAAILAVFRATGIRLAELAVTPYHPGDPGRSDAIGGAGCTAGCQVPRWM